MIENTGNADDGALPGGPWVGPPTRTGEWGNRIGNQPCKETPQ